MCISLLVHTVREPVEAWWHANYLSSNAATVLQCLVMVLYFRTVYGTILCSYVCMCLTVERTISGGHEVRFLHMGVGG